MNKNPDCALLDPRILLVSYYRPDFPGGWFKAHGVTSENGSTLNSLVREDLRGHG